MLLNDLQKAIFDALDTAHASIEVFDDVPDQREPPYVIIGEMTEVPFDTDDSVGRECTMVIHSWSTYRGMKELKDMMDTNKAALHDVDLVVGAGKFILGLLESSQAMLDPDGLTRHGVQRFRFITQGA